VKIKSVEFYTGAFKIRVMHKHNQNGFIPMIIMIILLIIVFFWFVYRRVAGSG